LPSSLASSKADVRPITPALILLAKLSLVPKDQVTYPITTTVLVILDVLTKKELKAVCAPKSASRATVRSQRDLNAGYSPSGL
jgi:hypothetical protein